MKKKGVISNSSCSNYHNSFFLLYIKKVAGIEVIKLEQVW